MEQQEQRKAQMCKGTVGSSVHGLRELEEMSGISLVVQWLGLHASTVGSAGLIPGQRIKIPHAAWHSQKERSLDR